tara:strand:+ start:291 stop:1262 length:972 start_codon:yes stop_codon:yes gene_type:complete
MDTNTNLWQSSEWQKYQESLGHEIRVYESTQVVVDKTVGGYCTWEIIRGPSSPIDNEELRIDNLLKPIIEDAKRNKCFALYISPSQELILNSQFSILNSSRHIVPEATRIIDLTKSEDEILAQMKQKGRYNIKVAQKHGVEVKQSDDVDAFYELIKKTSKRDGFKPHSKEHYKKFLENLDGAFMLLAFAPSIVNCQLSIVAGLIGVIFKGQGIYYYGASSHEHRNLMAPYLLQWEAMKFCKAKGCTSYDLFGIVPPEKSPLSQPVLSLSKEERGRERGANHPWQGVSAFKEKFGGEVVTYPEEKVIILKPLIHKLIDMKRKFF